MKLIVCLDKNNGMIFNKRRQSADRNVYQRILSTVCKNRRLWMNGYSAPLFREIPGNICVDEDFLQTAGEDDFCFVEDVDIRAFLARISHVTVFRWDKVYPADQYFPEELLCDPWVMINRVAFQGNSHDLIIQEEYER